MHLSGPSTLFWGKGFCFCTLLVNFKYSLSFKFTNNCAQYCKMAAFYFLLGALFFLLIAAASAGRAAMSLVVIDAVLWKVMYEAQSCSKCDNSFVFCLHNCTVWESTLVYPCVYMKDAEQVQYNKPLLASTHLVLVLKGGGKSCKNVQFLHTNIYLNTNANLGQVCLRL